MYKYSTLIRALILKLIPFLVIIIIWDLVVKGGKIDPIFVPPLELVFSSFLSLCLSTEFLSDHLLTSSIRVIIAFLLSVSIALPIGIISSQISWVSHLIEPICGFTRYLPIAGLVPLCILWFGIGTEQKISVIILGVVFQLVLLFASDAASVPNEFIESGKTFGLNRWQIIQRIVLPYSLPAIWDDMRISAGWAWSYLVLAELVAGNNGLGYFIIQSQRYLQIERVFAGILIVGILGALTDLLFYSIASRLFQWK
jgi:NitT/TauT family transport system permease protein